MPYIEFEDEEDYLTQKLHHEAKYTSKFTGYVATDYSDGFYQELDGTIRPLTLEEKDRVVEEFKKEEQVQAKLRKLKLL